MSPSVYTYVMAIPNRVDTPVDILGISETNVT